MDTIVIFSIAIATGLSVALGAWLVTNLVSDVPAEDRTWNDPPPLGFRVLWWPTLWVAFYLRPLISEKYHIAGVNKLRLAGLDYALNPTQFESSRIVWGLA